jgi:alkaline phosphatase
LFCFRPYEDLLSDSQLYFVLNLIKTYCVNAQTPDSASTATAMFTGVKTDFSTLGFDSSVTYQDVESEETAFKVTSVMAWAQDAGKDTGIVINRS